MSVDVIENMSDTQKFELMDSLWQSLSSSDSDVLSPKWHGDVLSSREEEVAVDWEEAKEKIFKSIDGD